MRAVPARWRILVTVPVFLSFACISSEPALEFRITIPESVHNEPVTGRVYVIVSRDPEIPARLQRSFGHQPVSSRTGDPFFAQDVEHLQPGETALIDAGSPGYPLSTLQELPAGDYYVQAVLNIYTAFERSDGHTVWAHMDQWEGQHFNWSPGNLTSRIQAVRLDPQEGYSIELSLSEEIAEVEIPPDTPWVRRVRMQSPLLTEFWGRPIHIGATLLLPKGYEEHPDTFYPTIYDQGHFSLDPPFGFSTEPPAESEEAADERSRRGLETGFEFYRAWNSDRFPRMVAVTLQHPTPYFDDSYAVNSANNGPYADALLRELIPHLEAHFRLIPEGYARVLTGGSTGGYEALALQVHHPEFFGGSWVFYPDPIDFRRFFSINIYEDENAFYAPDFALLKPLRYAFRTPDGQPLQSVRQLTQLHAALGSRGRSGEYLEAWEAAFGPAGPEGYPRPLWDRRTGQIDREVAAYYRDQGYDLSHYLQTHWPEIGRELAGKIHLYCGDMDHYYFNLAVYLLQEVLETRRDPPYGGTFEYGRPLRGHGWRPMNNAQLVRMMADHIRAREPRAGSRPAWHE